MPSGTKVVIGQLDWVNCKLDFLRIEFNPPITAPNPERCGYGLSQFLQILILCKIYFNENFKKLLFGTS